jgi:hypothetical protein
MSSGAGSRPTTAWRAAAVGALDLVGHSIGEEGYELLVLPIGAGAPAYLWGEGAAAWRSMVEQPVADETLDERTREVVLQLEQMGLATASPEVARDAIELARPWLQSPQHELVYALLAEVARENAIEIVFIKGPALHAQGLREREHSGDVDCWVRPGEEVRLAEAMVEWGWTPLYSAFLGTGVPHSLTLQPAEWGCAIDVHSRFPGMAISPEAAFEYVQARSEPRSYAGVRVRTPSTSEHAVMTALHELRPAHGRQPSPTQIANARRALEAAGPETIRSANDLGAGYVLREVLREVYGESSTEGLATPRPDDWAWRSASGPRRYVKAFLTVPWRHRARVLVRLIWPSNAMMLSVEGQTEAPVRELVLARVRRFSRAIRVLVRRK